jgi:hypothetical protein
MPWVAACFDLLATPLLGYCLAIRKLALQAGFLEEKKSDLAVRQTSNTETLLNADTTTIMAPNAEEQRQGKVSRGGESLEGCELFAYIICILLRH